MKVAIVKLEFLPRLDSFLAMLKADMCVLMDEDLWSPSGYQARCRMTWPNSLGWRWLSVPVISAGPGLEDMEVDNSEPWNDALWRRLTEEYESAAGWSLLQREIQPVLAKEWDSLVELNVEMIHAMNRALGVTTPIVLLSELVAETVVQESRELLIRDICNEMEAETCLSMVRSPGYTRVHYEEGVRCEDYLYESPTYTQTRQPFVHDLSAVDIVAQLGAGAEGFVKSL